MATVTQQDIDTAEIYGWTPEEAAEAREQAELPVGTYDFVIAGGKVEVVSKDGVMKGAIQANLQLKPKASDGSTAKRYGTVFKRITLPVANGEFVPNSIGRSAGVADIKWLSEQTGISQADLVRGFKALQFPAGVLTKTIRGYYKLRADKNDATKFWPEVKPAKASDKLSPLAADGSNASAGAMASTAPAAGADNEIPF